MSRHWRSAERPYTEGETFAILFPLACAAAVLAVLCIIAWGSTH